MLEAALALAAHGWPVFPCHPKTKQPLTEHGFEDATTDAEKIRAWWARWPGAMIGLPTGKAIGAFVIDFDPGTDEKTGEIFKLADLVKALALELGHPWPKTVAARTPRGGRHAYFKLPEGELPGNRAGMIKRIDVRGEGGYVIAPPSVRADGVAYQWVSGCAPCDLELAIAPPALLDCIFRRGKWSRDAARAPDGEDAGARRERDSAAAVDVSAHIHKYALAAVATEAAKVGSAGRGERNDKLNRAALCSASSSPPALYSRASCAPSSRMPRRAAG
jgi:putative DNA primase/helicase